MQEKQQMSYLIMPSMSKFLSYPPPGAEMGAPQQMKTLWFKHSDSEHQTIAFSTIEEYPGYQKNNDVQPI